MGLTLGGSAAFRGCALMVNFRIVSRRLSSEREESLHAIHSLTGKRRLLRG
jgi:hypothetical protein